MTRQLPARDERQPGGASRSGAGRVGRPVCEGPGELSGPAGRTEPWRTAERADGETPGDDQAAAAARVQGWPDAGGTWFLETRWGGRSGGRRYLAQRPDLAQRGRTRCQWSCQGRDRGGADSDRMRSSAIAVSGLRKAYGDKIVLDGINLDVPASTVFSLLGPNGAGKTTTVNVLTTLIKADSGTVRVAGHDIAIETKAVRAVIGVTGQFAAVDELLTGEENLQLMADLHHLRAGEGKRVVTSLLERFDLVEPAQKMAATYSGGMRRKLDLAMTLVTRPQIIFPDEPTAGLDPRSRRTMWNIVRELVADGVTVFLTTQYLEEADQLADRIAVLDQGHLVAQGTPDALKRQVPGSHVPLRFTDVRELDAAARVLTGSTVDDAALTLRVPSDGRAKSLRALLDRLDEHSIDVEEFSVHTPDLDDVFLALTGHASTAENTQ